MKYASDGSTNQIGIIIEGMISKKSKIINYDSLEQIKENVILLINEMKVCSSSIILEYLNDSGLFAALLGYDAIYVEDKKYIVVLNRSQMIINMEKLKQDLIGLSDNSFLKSK